MTMPSKIIITAAVLGGLLLCLSGGASACDEANAKHPEKHHAMKHARHECTGQGLKPGTEAFRACMKGEKEEMKAEWQQRKTERKAERQKKVDEKN